MVKRKKYMYYNCGDCHIYFRKDKIEYVLLNFILSLVEYDEVVKKYFYPILAEKEEVNTENIDKEIAELEKQRNRIKKAFISGRVEMEDFAEDYKSIGEKLNKLEQDKMKNMEIDTEHFSLMKIMVDRDFEIESRLSSDSFVEDLKTEWDTKTKLEKQEFISKFIESTVQEDKMITMPREKGNERLMRAVFVDNNKSFPIKDSKGKVRGKLGAVSYREKGITDKNELDNYYEAISDLVLYKTEQTEDGEESSED